MRLCLTLCQELSEELSPIHTQAAISSDCLVGSHHISHTAKAELFHLRWWLRLPLVLEAPIATQSLFFSPGRTARNAFTIRHDLNLLLA